MHEAPHHPSLTLLRDWIATLPESHEEETWGEPTFRCRKKIFAVYGTHDGRPCLSVKANKAEQAEVLDLPGFFYPSYVGRFGWIGVVLDEYPWEDVLPLLERAWASVAPKTVQKQRQR